MRDSGVIPASIVKRFREGTDPPYTIIGGFWQMEAYCEFIERGHTHRTEILMRAVKSAEAWLRERYRSNVHLINSSH